MARLNGRVCLGPSDLRSSAALLYEGVHSDLILALHLTNDDLDSKTPRSNLDRWIADLRLSFNQTYWFPIFNLGRCRLILRPATCHLPPIVVRVELLSHGGALLALQ
jgi:hypothetical protein